MNPIETIQLVYAAFQRGDVPAILEHCSDDVQWDNSRVASRVCPWNGNFSGKKNVPGFFKAVGENLNISVFNPIHYVQTGNHVAVYLRIESTVTRTGRHLANDSIHFWSFDAGNRIVGYKHFNDTAAELEAWSG